MHLLESLTCSMDLSNNSSSQLRSSRLSSINFYSMFRPESSSSARALFFEVLEMQSYRACCLAGPCSAEITLANIEAVHAVIRNRTSEIERRADQAELTEMGWCENVGNSVETFGRSLEERIIYLHFPPSSQTVRLSLQLSLEISYKNLSYSFDEIFSWTFSMKRHVVRLRKGVPSPPFRV